MVNDRCSRADNWYIGVISLGFLAIIRNNGRDSLIEDNREPRVKQPFTPKKVKTEVVKEEKDYESMTVKELKEILKDKGLKVSGRKKELIGRLNDN